MFENMAIMKGARIAVETCMKLRPEETVVVVTDSGMVKLAEAFTYAAAYLGAKTVTTIMEPTKQHAAEPPEPVSEAMKAGDVLLLPTTMSLSHTEARRAATKKGARIASMPTITERMMSVGGLTADYREVAALTKKVGTRMKSAKNVTITTPSGTALKMSVEGRPALEDTGLYHQRGDWGNLPAGEVCLAPVEGTTNGIFVIDSLVDTALHLSITRPLQVTVKDGWARKFEGPDAAQLLKVLEASDNNAYNIAELGIGTNGKARVIGNVLEDEKVLGTVHIAVGDNTSFQGGHTKSNIHLDGILFKPTVTVDKKVLMKDGKLLVN